MGIRFFGKAQEPTLDDIHEQQARRPSATEAIAADRRRKSVSDKRVTGASQITVRQSIIPVSLVTILFFLCTQPHDEHVLNCKTDHIQGALPTACSTSSTHASRPPSTSPKANPPASKAPISAPTSSVHSPTLAGLCASSATDILSCLVLASTALAH